MLIVSIPIFHALSNQEQVRRYALLGGVTFLATDDATDGHLPPVPAEFLREFGVLVGPLGLSQAEEARPWLHEGAYKAFFKLPHGVEAPALEGSLAGLPRDRVGLCIDAVDPVTDADTILARLVSVRQAASTVLLSTGKGQGGAKALVDLVKAMNAALKAASPPERVAVLVSPGGGWSWTASDVALLHSVDVNVVVPAGGANAVPITSPRADGVSPEKPLPLKGVSVDTVDVFIACLRTDREDGLFATVVVDENNVALGLVYSSADSIRASVASGRGVYYSRSRGGLWRKGDTSGAVQDLVRIDMDCDSDALRFVVKQKGNPPAFCHLNRRNCWVEDRGLAALQRTLQSRKVEAPEGSYTSRLFKDPVLLRNKLLEEAQELVEAETKDHVAAEAADLLYFAMVRCVAADVTLEDVERHLDARTLKLARRPGHSKSFRIEAAEALLKQTVPPAGAASTV